jgi:hypothetical protein
LAFAEQSRRPYRSNAKRSRRYDLDPDRLRKPLGFLDARIGRAPRSLARQLGYCDDRTLAAGNLDRAITVEFGTQDSASPSSSCSGPSFSECAGCRVEMACL